MSLFEKQTVIVGEFSIKDILKDNKKVEDVWSVKSDKLRILFCGTYPIGTTNGYSKITYYTSKYLGKYEDEIDLSVWGFQNYKQTSGAIRNEIPPNVKLIDPLQLEKDNNIESSGFGEKVIGQHLKENAYDVIIIFNDSMITSAVTANIINEMHQYRSKFKLISYMDQVYMFQKADYINLLNQHFDAIIAFTSFWKDNTYRIGVRKDMPVYVYNHGFDAKLNFPIPKSYCRYYYDLPQDAFIIESTNRNQPRKAWDIAIISWALFVKRHWTVNVRSKDIKQEYKTNHHTKRPILFAIGTSQEGHWDLLSLLEHECKLIDLDFEYAKKTLWFTDNPQRASDRDINIFMSVCDVNFAPVHAEGWGLTCSESLGVGKAQVASYVGGHKEFMDDTMSTLIRPKLRKYGELTNNMKGIGSIDEICLPEDFMEGLWKYFSNPDLCEKHGNRGRKHILTNYNWEKVVTDFKKNVLNNFIRT
jgi:glycosyltransferase involved in cell wall biosynthesis